MRVDPGYQPVHRYKIAVCDANNFDRAFRFLPLVVEHVFEISRPRLEKGRMGIDDSLSKNVAGRILQGVSGRRGVALVNFEQDVACAFIV